VLIFQELLEALEGCSKAYLQRPVKATGRAALADPAVNPEKISKKKLSLLYINEGRLLQIIKTNL